MKNKNNNTYNELAEIIKNKSILVSQYIKKLNDDNIENTIDDFKNSIEQLQKDNKSITDKLNDNIKKDNFDLNTIKEIGEELAKIRNNLYKYEESVANLDNKEIHYSLRKIAHEYENNQTKYIEIKFDMVNKKIDEKIEDAEKTTSGMMFNILSIFVSISATSSMVAGIEYISKEYIVFYFYTCCVLAITILIVSSSILKKTIDRKTVVIYTLFMLGWIFLAYNPIPVNKDKEKVEDKIVEKVKNKDIVS